MIPGELLRKKLSSSSLTEEELTDILKEFVKLVTLYLNAIIVIFAGIAT